MTIELSIIAQQRLGQHTTLTTFLLGEDLLNRIKCNSFLVIIVGLSIYIGMHALILIA